MFGTPFFHARRWTKSMTGLFMATLSSNRPLRVFIVALLLSSASGCRLCCDSGDADYSAYGGVWARTQRETGRVGSVFDPGGAIAEKITPKASIPDQRQQVYGNDDEQTPRPPDTTEPAPADDSDESFEERLERFKEQSLESIGVTPGQPLPPDIQ